MAKKSEKAEPLEADKAIDALLEKPIAELSLSLRTINVLEKDGLLFVGDLLNCTVGRLKAIRNVHDRTLEEIFAALREIGFVRTGERITSKGDRS